MFSLNGYDHVELYKARQQEFEADAQRQRLVKALTANGDVSPIRQRVGSLLIWLGKTIAREPKQDVRLALSARH